MYILCCLGINTRFSIIPSIKYTEGVVENRLVFLVIVGLVVSSVRVALLSVDLVITLDVRALAGESDPPLGVGVVTVAGLLLAIVVVGLSILNGPIEVVVRDVGVIHVLLSVSLFVSLSGSDGDQSEENDSDL